MLLSEGRNLSVPKNVHLVSLRGTAPTPVPSSVYPQTREVCDANGKMQCADTAPHLKVWSDSVALKVPFPSWK